ncbi:MAG: AAA family ATPase [Clostridiales bacterium]|nr:AAA family ATPase [Clostridiales bacterium]
MKVAVENLGIIRKADFEVGDLTIICGNNNTGKTYATYALYGFISFWNEAFSPVLFGDEAVNKLFNSGSIKIDLDEIHRNSNDIVDQACKEYIKQLPMVFAAAEKHFSNTDFKVCINESEIDFSNIEEAIQTIGPNRKPVFNLSKKRGEHFVTINMVAKAEDIDEINKDWIIHWVTRQTLDIVFGRVFPEVFIASIERTGATIFRRELDFIRNRLLENVSNRDKDIDPFALIDAINDKRYALPVKADVEFNRNLEDVVKKESAISQINPDILKSFDSIVGGEYKSTKEGFYYVPDKGNVKLSMGEGSSSVRSLLNMGIYIRHIANPGDILMIDEPELNLHPMNQRRMARTLAKLVNAGVKVFITTHSDYIIKEFNTLIMLNRSDASAGRVMEKYQYQENELLDAGRIKAYIAKKELITIEGAKKRQRHNTFVLAPIDKYGIEISDFDETINKMNEIQDELLFGGQVT